MLDALSNSLQMLVSSKLNPHSVLHCAPRRQSPQWKFLLVSKEHPLALAKTVLLGDAMLGGYTLLLVSGESQLAKERNGLPVPVQH